MRVAGVNVATLGGRAHSAEPARGSCGCWGAKEGKKGVKEKATCTIGGANEENAGGIFAKN